MSVTLTSSAKLPSRKRPKTVTVKAGGKTIRLVRAAAVNASAVRYSSSWQSNVVTGPDVDVLGALNGKSVRLTLKSKSGTTKIKSRAAVQQRGGSGSAALFPVPPQPLTGNEAFNFLSPYFLNSAFSDCEAPWPACAVEERYVHCPSGAWEYHRNTPTSGSDIHAYSTFTVTGADVLADGTWAVKYTDNAAGAVYVWQVAPNGVATGVYQFGGSTQNLGPMIWSQPAITWQRPAGAC